MKRQRRTNYRGSYRGVYSILFDTVEFQALSPNARLALLVARQCKDAGPAAIYRFYPEMLKIRTGLTEAELDEALKELLTGGWIEIEGPIIWIVNGLKYDPSMNLCNHLHMLGVQDAIAALPKLDIVIRFCNYYKVPKPFGGPDQGSGKPSDTLDNSSVSVSVSVSGSVSGSGGGSRGDRARKPNAMAEVDPMFLLLWRVSPQGGGRDRALREWVRLGPDEALARIIVDAMKTQRVWPDRQGVYFPHVHNWLRDQRWMDVPPAIPIMSRRTAGNALSLGAFAKTKDT